jgi:hypothetical protein
MCASPLRGAAAPVGAAEYELRLSAFCFRFFFVLSVIRAEAALANASTGIGLLQLRMERRVAFEERRSANGYVGGDGSSE